jgi:hypothetical protein
MYFIICCFLSFFYEDDDNWEIESVENLDLVNCNNNW